MSSADLSVTARFHSPRTPSDLAIWHGRQQEEVIEIGLPIIDAHHHLWVRPPDKYLLDELLTDTGSGHNICATVFVECRSMYRKNAAVSLAPVGETEFVNGVAAMSASGLFGRTMACAGIVGYADLTLGAAVEATLVSHLNAAPARFRGIRNRAQFEPTFAPGHSETPGLLADPRFREGFAKLGPLGLSYDSWNYYKQIDELADLAEAFPETPIILDHVGGILGVGDYVGRQSEVFDVWRSAILRLARSQNTFVKIGGLGMLTCGFPFAVSQTPPSSEELAAAWKPYVETCLEAFGPDRAMFESNFPVDGQSCGYVSLWNAFKLLTQSLSPSERHALFFGTAKKTYRLHDVPAVKMCGDPSEP